MTTTRLSDLSSRQKALLGAITVLAIAVRISFQSGRSFWGDEAGTLMFIQRDPWFILSNFEPWLTMNYFLLAEKLIADFICAAPSCLVALPMLASIATVPAVAALALKVSGPRTAMATSFLVAVNPYLVDFGVKIRSYSLLVLFCVLGLNAFLRWTATLSTRSAVSCAAFFLLACLSHPTGAYAAATVAVLWIGRVLRARSKGTAARTYWIFGAAGVVAAAVMIAAYVPILDNIRATRGRAASDLPIAFINLPAVAGAYFGPGYLAILSIALIAGGVVLAVTTRPALRVPAVAALLPFVLLVAQRFSHYPWAQARFVIFVLPPLLILMAAAITWLGTRPTFPAGTTVVLVALAALSWLPNWQTILGKKADNRWSEVADYIVRHSPQGTAVVAVDLDRIFMTPYFFDVHGAAPFYGGLAPNALGDPEWLKTLTEPRPAALVVSGSAITTTLPTESFGRIRVVLYPAATGLDHVQSIRADLTRTVATRIDAELVNHYMILMLADRAANESSGALRHALLYALSENLKWAGIALPPQAATRAAEWTYYRAVGTQADK
jgi:hypothetical protein